MYKSKNYLMCTYTVCAYFGIFNNGVGGHRLCFQGLILLLFLMQQQVH